MDSQKMYARLNYKSGSIVRSGLALGIMKRRCFFAALVCVSMALPSMATIAHAEDQVRGILQKSVPENSSKEQAKTGNTKKKQALQGVAYARKQMTADIQARDELQNNLLSRLKSSPTICKRVDKRFLALCDSSNNKIITQTKLPLMGVNFQKVRGKSGMKGSKASLMPHLALSQYREAIKKEIRAMEKLKITEDARGIKKRRGMTPETHMMRFYQLASVAALLGDDSYISKSFKLPEKMSNFKPGVIKVASMDEAISEISSTFKPKATYIYPPRPMNSLEITPFGSAFSDNLEKKMLGKTTNIQFGTDSMSGTYDMVNDKMMLSYEHYDKNFLLQGKLTLEMDGKAVQKFRTAPMSAEFDKLFAENNNQQSGLYSQIATQKGSQDLLFRKGDSINLYVRLSQPGYFYIVGHIARPDGEYSYLVDINDGDPPGLFVRYVRPEEVNQVIELGAFDVYEPYGVEYLQLVSSTKDLKNKLPEYSYDEKLGYYVINKSRGNAKEGIKAVRALKRVDKSIKYHESQLAYTTME